MIKILDKDVLFLLDHFVICSVRRLMSEVNIPKVGEVDIHFTNVLKEFGAVEFLFGLIISESVR